MTQFSFGSGTLILKRTDVANTPPALMGTLQDISLDFDRKIETLLGQYNMAVAAGGGELKITGKAKFARLQATQLSNLFFGQNATTTTPAMLEMAVSESHSVPASSPYTVTVSNSASFTEDLGVFYAAGGAQLTPVASGPAQGQYSVSGGTYTFNSADEGAAVNLYYGYTETTAGNQIALANTLMGPLPTFELWLKETFNYYGASKDLVVKLNACVSSKLALPFTNSKFTVSELDLQALADSSNNIGTISLTE